MRYCKIEGCSNTIPDYERNHKCSTCRHNLRRYGLTVPARNAMLVGQDNKCAICDNPTSFEGEFNNKGSAAVVDHCHKTGKVRGILCGHCNMGLGKFKDSISSLAAAIRYLDE